MKTALSLSIIISVVLLPIDHNFMLLLILCFALNSHRKYKSMQWIIFLKNFIMVEGLFNLLYCVWYYNYG